MENKEYLKLIALSAYFQELCDDSEVTARSLKDQYCKGIEHGMAMAYHSASLRLRNAVELMDLEGVK